MRLDTYNADEYIGGIGDIEDLFILLINAAISFINKKWKIYRKFPRLMCVDMKAVHP
jgi:hypothetical protein